MADVLLRMKEPLKETYLTQRRKQRMVRILRPDFTRIVHGNVVTPRVADYIEVPRLATFGTFPAIQMISLAEQAQLSRFRDQLAGVIRRKR